VRPALAAAGERWEAAGPQTYRVTYEIVAIDFNRITIDSVIVDGQVTEHRATFGGDPVPATELNATYFPATVEDFLAYFDRFAADGDLTSLTLDEHGWYPAEGATEPVPAADDGGFSWTLSVDAV